MRQVILNSTAAIVARVPRPVVPDGGVLVKVSYSLVSSGTELAPLLAARQAAGVAGGSGSHAEMAVRYFGKAIRDPRKAARRLNEIAGRTLRSMRSGPAPVSAPAPVSQDGAFGWTAAAALDFKSSGAALRFVTDSSPFAYQAVSSPVSIPPSCGIRIEFTGQVTGGPICIGALAGAQGAWIGQRSYGEGRLDEHLVLDAGDANEVSLAIANAGAERPVQVDLESIALTILPPGEGAGHSEMGHQGWAVGYSVCGVVEAVGAGVTDLAVGDVVACAGANQANHADYVAVKRNLATRVPAGCDPRWAASATVGAIALQGVRRAMPQLGETIAVIGLGLLGQLSAQMLRANGCTVIGTDIDPKRVARAVELGLDAGSADAAEFRAMVRDMTGGHGADRVIIAAATPSSALINLAMDIARRKGVVVIVGDVGLQVERAAFYRKEIDLLMSTSYGPGRYDASYEERNNDYPFAYVRWTVNRNMAAYLHMVERGQVKVASLIDRIVPVDRAPAIYHEMVEGPERPLGVLLSYEGATSDPAPELVRLRGHRKPRIGPINYVLVGAGAYGTSMIVPQMDKFPDSFFLRGVVSRDPIRGGNFARSRDLEMLASDLASVIANEEIGLVAIATRHDQHAGQVAAALSAGKHVFVEKPLALNWDQLDRVVAAYHGAVAKPIVMVGFNRRFAPALQKLSDLLRTRRSPLMVNYRVNAGYIPADHWLQGSAGGGRNIGEACHMYDVFRFLAGAAVTSIEARAIHPPGDAWLRNDNFCATLGYADGSLCTLTYTALGPKAGLGKERIEVFCDGEAYLVDDFKTLTCASRPEPLWSAPEADKGHYEEFRRLAEALNSDAASPIAFDELVEATAVALRIEEQL